MRACYLACIMLCVGACASTLEPAPRKPNVISMEGISSEFDAMARKHAAAHAKWLVENMPAAKQEAVTVDEIEHELADVATTAPSPQEHMLPDGINLQESSSCRTVAEVGGSKLGFVADRYLFGDGAALVTCAVSNLAVAFTGAVIQSAQEVERVGRPCYVYYDIDRPSGGGFFFYFESSTTAPVFYVDDGSPAHRTEIKMGCTTR